jgi:transcriptional regulator with XRE-family HTH domain
MTVSPGTRIRELRQIADMSQGELGRRVGVQRAAIHKYENGSVENIPLKTIEKIANVFDVSPTYIVGWNGEYSNPLAAEVRIVQGVKTFFGMEALELLETYLALDNAGKKRLVQYSEEVYKLYKL